ncbi:MAG: hypothetical protein AAFY76_00880 [Cyanobacteria bacterium J06649_11]
MSCSNIEPLIETIATASLYECGHIGLSGQSSEIYTAYERLRDKATDEELIELFHHQNSLVSVYAGYALIDKKIMTADKVFGEIIKRDTVLSTMCGCLLSSSKASQLIYSHYWNTRQTLIDDQERHFEIKDSASLLRMDSIILHSNIYDLLYPIYVFRNRVYPKSYNTLIEQWAFEKEDFYALEYTHKNIRQGNEEKLKSVLRKKFESEDTYVSQKAKIVQMLKEI